ncbi:MAG: COX15/CtaA family protein [Hyphomonadaceae bacterium]|nr:COX15/CtaA family protein [Hyphomonadaceae bacterium]
MASHRVYKHSSAVTLWLFIIMSLVIAIVVIGGATRLTNSGLSITEWRPVSGALPPFSAEAWQSEFDKYKLIEEFKAENPDMDLDGFKFIYLMEWGHRQFARLIGLVYLIPLVLFLYTNRIKKDRRWRFISIFLLICFQGYIGWWMVSSGVGTKLTDVSQYRLATHLGLAFIILALVYWTWRDQAREWTSPDVLPPYRKRTLVLALLVYIQIIVGAFVAGSNAGYAYNTWPLMDGGLVPGGYFAMSPAWLNMFENTAAIQFNHRILAYIVTIVAVWVWWSVRKRAEKPLRRATNWLMVAVIFQVILGIVALLKVAELPYALGHQAGAIVVFIFALWAMRAARYRF